MPNSLKDQLKEKDREIALLHAIARIVSSTRQFGELLQKFSDLMAEQLRADAVLIYIFDEDKEQLILQGSHHPRPQQVGRIKLKLGEGITGWVAEKRKTVAINDKASDDSRFKLFNSLPEDRYEAFLSVPVFLKEDELLGVLNIQHRKAHKYSVSEIRLAEHITEEIAEAIGQSRLHHESKKKTQALQTLAKMSQTIAQGAYLREILQLIVTMTAELMGSKICSLMLLDEKSKTLKIEATQSLSEAYKSKPPVPLKGSVSGRAILEKRPIAIHDISKDPQYAYPDLARQESLQSLVVVPMMIKDKSIGVLNCYTSNSHRFTDDEIQLLQAVANQAGVAIEHTRAIEQAVAAQEALENRKVIDRAKGILMRQGLTEEASFRLIQRQAMDRRKSMKEVAEAVILSEEINQKK
jgi:GAF domain-containing protein